MKNNTALYIIQGCEENNNQLRDYGDNRHLILHLPAADPARHELQKRAAWLATYASLATGKLMAVDLAFEYQTRPERERLKKWLATVSAGGTIT